MKTENYYQSLFEKSNQYYASDREDILPFVPNTIKTSLEFGCGQGSFSALLKQRFGAETWAVELNPVAAEVASQKIDKVIQKDAIEAMSQLPDSYFDGIFFLDVLEHLDNPFLLIEACRQKLSEKGVLIASIPNIRYYSFFKKYVFHGEWEYQQQGIMDIGHIRFFTYKSIQNMCRNLNYYIHTIKGHHPTRSRGYRLLNLIALNRLWDVRYKHFVVVAGKSAK